VSLGNCLAPSLLLRKTLWSESLAAHRCLLLASALTLFAAAADQLAAPILQTTSPLWASAAWLLLVWRRGKSELVSADSPIGRSLSPRRLAAFTAAHIVVVLVARLSTSAFQHVAGTATVGGTLVAAWKLSVLFPTLLLFPLPLWKELRRAYGPEGLAALAALLRCLPRRAMEALWPWYGLALGRIVYTLSWFFVPGLGYERDLTPTLIGPQQDTTLVFACSGISGIELFGYLFGFVALLDWNRLRKGRALFIYVVGVFAMLLGNALRITSLVVLANRGFVDFVSRFHISAGTIFFFVIFLVYLSLTYKWMLRQTNSPVRLGPNM
jgi:exosortase/archaeosortase family protein